MSDTKDKEKDNEELKDVKRRLTKVENRLTFVEKQMLVYKRKI